MSVPLPKSDHPIIVLAPLGSKASVFVAAMGRHPDLFAAPHLNLLAFERPQQMLYFSRMPRDVHLHGLLRTISLMLFGEQSVQGIRAAVRWLHRHGKMSSSSVHALIARNVLPQRLVEYSPLYTHHVRVLERVVESLPSATFIHLVRHPTATALEIARAAMQTLTAVLRPTSSYGTNQPCLDIVELGDTVLDWSVDPPVFDPQFLWFRTHTCIASVLARNAPHQTLRVRVEDLLSNPPSILSAIIKRLNLKNSKRILSAMLRTEHDAFSRPGPYGAAAGVDWDFVNHPRFPSRISIPRSGGPLPWRDDKKGYRPEVIALAEDLGYRSSGRIGPASVQWNVVRA